MFSTNFLPSLMLALPSNDQLIKILLIIVAAAILWVVLRFILRLATRIFALGCTLILVLGLILVFVRYFR